MIKVKLVSFSRKLCSSLYDGLSKVYGEKTGNIELSENPYWQDIKKGNTIILDGANTLLCSITYMPLYQKGENGGL